MVADEQTKQNKTDPLPLVTSRVMILVSFVAMKLVLKIL